ncbi:MAG: glycosyltransferase family 2 protein [Chloroflexi bacterium]|nr:glycosyltransferase family 2 protein [Chloroflexota bacterium]
MTAAVAGGPALTVAMPAFDEAGNLERVVRDVLASLRSTDLSTEILIVDDGSTDGTAVIADQLAAELAEVRAVHHGRNRGLGAGWRTCIAESRGDWVFIQPADGQMESSTARRFYDVRGASDIVVGIRTRWQRPLHRRLLTTGFHLVTRLALGVSLPGDYGVCFLFRGDLVRALPVVSGDLGVAVIVEWLFLARQRGARISLEQAEVLPRLSGTSKSGRLGDSLATLMHILRAAVAHRLLRRG